MMRRAAEKGTKMNVGLTRLREALKKIFHQLDLKIADTLGRDLRFHNTVWPSAEIHRGGGQRFVHGHQEVAGTQDAALGAESFLYRFAKSNADVFDGLMLVHVEVAASVHLQIKRSVPSYPV